MTTKFNILLVEDDQHLGFMLKDNLEIAGYKVRLCRDGEKGLTAFHNDNFDLCLLDVMMPIKDGFSVAAQIRKYNSQIPVIFLTSKNAVKDRVKGFKVGGDDYITKPFSLEELLLRVEAVLKRVYNHETKADKKNLFSLGIFDFDFNNQLLSSASQSITLTHKEAQLLKLLAQHKNHVVERDIILKSVWENDGYFVARSMDVFISKLRKYLSMDPTLSINNIRGVGYRLSTASA